MCVVAHVPQHVPRRLATLLERQGVTGGPFEEPLSHHSVNGVLEVSLSMTVLTYVGPTSTITTRVLGGSLPGPLLVLLPGEKLKISFSNDVYETPDFPARGKTPRSLVRRGRHDAVMWRVSSVAGRWFLSSSGSLGRGTKCTCGVHLSYQCFSSSVALQ